MDQEAVSYLPCPVAVEADLKSAKYDCVLFVHHSLEEPPKDAAQAHLFELVKKHVKVNESAASAPAFVPVQDFPHGRLVYSPTGPVNRDFDDVRRFGEAGTAGIKKAISTGAKNILLVVGKHAVYDKAQMSTLLGVLYGLYVSAEARQHGVKPKAESIGFWSPNSDLKESNELVHLATALEAGRTVARDISGASPAFLPPPAAAQFVWAMLNRSPAVKAEIIADQEKILEDYPICAAVNRAVNNEPKYECRVVKLTYTGEGTIDKTLMFVGKGVTFDSGGMDLKVGGAMLGMSHDKGGAAAVAGFFKVLALLKPKGLKVCATIPFVRNGVGPDAVTCDEVITSRSGKRMRIVNTDAEGRMIMVDPLCEMVEKAKNEINPQLFTVATLTGHAVLTVGSGYFLALDNGPAAVNNETASSMKLSGDSIGDPGEVSSIRREDFDFHLTNCDDEDLLQGHSKPSSQTPRAHQIPAAFLILGSRLEEHGNGSAHPIAYTHLDIAGAEEGEATTSIAHKPSGSPILALSNLYVMPRL